MKSENLQHPMKYPKLTNTKGGKNVVGGGKQKRFN